MVSQHYLYDHCIIVRTVQVLCFLSMNSITASSIIFRAFMDLLAYHILWLLVLNHQRKDFLPLLCSLFLEISGSVFPSLWPPDLSWGIRVVVTEGILILLCETYSNGSFINFNTHEWYVLFYCRNRVTFWSHPPSPSSLFHVFDLDLFDQNM